MTKTPNFARIFVTFEDRSPHIIPPKKPHPQLFWRLTNRLALACLRALRVIIKQGGAALKPLLPVLASFLPWIIAWIILPCYKLFLLIKIRLGRVLATTHGFVFLLFTNRYVAHAALLVISVATVATQLPTKSVTASDTRRTLLYAMVTHGEDEIVQESVSERQTKNANYLGSDTIQALPGIDFDYEDDADQLPADLTIPGNIAIRPDTEPASSGDERVPRRTTTETYLVQSGDTVAAIAKKYGVNVGTIIWANRLTARSIIRPGDQLKVPPVSGLLHTVKRGDTIEKIAQLYRAKSEELSATNRLTPEQTLRIGDELVVPGGIPPEPPRPAKPRALAGVRPDVPLSRVQNKTYDQYQELVRAPLDNRLKPPDAETVVVPGNKFLWPTKSHSINQYYGWRHTGLDLEGDYTDPIYAADDGVVEKAGWNASGYGLVIFVDHENGIKTRYAHASKIFVQEGEQVKRGQVIAMIGTTGRSTGTHLHFEVLINGRRVNPLGYIR